MASTTAMFSGLSGLSSNARKLEVIGNNISNANTTAFKSNRLMFQSQFARSFSLGSVPSSVNGGTNPGQIGLGVTAGVTQRNFTTGGVSTTGVPTDFALDGDGFFIVEEAGKQLYTRDGSFQFNSSNDLVTPSGARVQGFATDSQYNIIDGVLTDINIPLGVQTIAEATRRVEFSGNLNADGALPSVASQHDFNLRNAGGTDLATTDLLVDVADQVAGVPVFAAADQITISGAERGGKLIPDATYTVTGTETIQDFFDWVARVTGIVDGGGVQPTDPAVIDGSTVNSLGGIADIPASPPSPAYIRLTGNIGELNDLSLDPDNFTINAASGLPNPFAPIKRTSADGESVRTSYTVYDSLGTPLRVDVTMVLAGTDNNGTYWRSFLHSGDDTDDRLHLENGSPTAAGIAVPFLQFDNDGRLLTADPIPVELDRFNTGAVDPLVFDVVFESEGSKVTAFSSPDGTSGPSTLASTFQDGSPLGVLSSFSVGIDGTITGGFSNGLTRTLGQVVLANFTNPEGLVDTGDNKFEAGPNSGSPLVSTPLGFGTGGVIGGALELSNVDLSQEFTSMILTSTGYSASSRVITTADDLLQQLLAIAR
jgi:flagellar hook protein FlgE